MTQIEATRGPLRPLLLTIWPRPLTPCWRASEPPVRGERHSAEDRRLHPRWQNHLRAQQTDPGCHEAAREGLTEAVSTIREGRKRNPEPRGETFAWPKYEFIRQSCFISKISLNECILLQCKQNFKLWTDGRTWSFPEFVPRAVCLHFSPADRFFYVLICHVFCIIVCLHLCPYRKAPVDEIISMRLKSEGMWDLNSFCLSCLSCTHSLITFFPLDRFHLQTGINFYWLDWWDVASDYWDIYSSRLEEVFKLFFPQLSLTCQQMAL